MLWVEQEEHTIHSTYTYIHSNTHAIDLYYGKVLHGVNETLKEICHANILGKILSQRQKE